MSIIFNQVKKIVRIIVEYRLQLNMIVITGIVFFVFLFTLSYDFYYNYNNVFNIKRDNQIKIVATELDKISVITSVEVKRIKTIGSMLESEFINIDKDELSKKNNFEKIVDTVFKTNDSIEYVGIYNNGRAVFSSANQINFDANSISIINTAPINLSPLDIELSETDFILKLYYENNYKYLEAIKTIKTDKEKNNNYLLIVRMNADILNIYFDKNEPVLKGIFYLSDTNGNLIFSYNKDKLNVADKLLVKKYLLSTGKSTAGYFKDDDGKSIKYVFYNKIGYLNSAVFLLLPQQYIDNSKISSINFLIYSTLICTFVLLAVFLLFKKVIYNPLDKTAKTMYMIVNGDFGFEVEMNKNNKLYPFTDNLNTLVIRLKDLINNQYTEKILRKQAELNALQSQINPHFLYNTLDSIRGQALSEGVENIANMTKALSNLFKYSISLKENLVSFGEELENVDYYLIIQQFRFDNKFIVVKEIEEDKNFNIMDYKMPKLTIQPIVENAIYHGLETKEGIGTIKIWAYTTEDRLIINIEDDGIGIEQEKLEIINEGFFNRSNVIFNDETRTGIALFNVDERVKLYFGENYGLRINSTYSIGTNVEIVLPLVKNKNTKSI